MRKILISCSLSLIMGMVLRLPIFRKLLMLWIMKMIPATESGLKIFTEESGCITVNITGSPSKARRDAVPPLPYGCPNHWMNILSLEGVHYDSRKNSNENFTGG